MKKLLKYKDGTEYVIGGRASIQPNGVTPIEEYDLSDLTNNEFEELRKNPKVKKLLKKAKRL